MHCATCVMLSFFFDGVLCCCKQPLPQQVKAQNVFVIKAYLGLSVARISINL